MEKEKTLIEKIEKLLATVEINDSIESYSFKIRKGIFIIFNQFIKDILDEIEFAQQDPYDGFDGQILELISNIIEEISGFNELE